MKRITLTPEQAGWLDATFARNRATYAGWTMEAAQAADESAAAETSGDSAEQNSDAEATDQETAAEGIDYKNKFEAQQKVNRDLERKFKEAASAKARVAELEEHVAKLAGKEAEYAASLEAQRIKDDALAKANDRIRRSEVKAAAKGVLKQADDAFVHLDLDQFEVSDDGEVDEDAIKAALEDLVANKPYLAVQDGRRFQGDADGGARKESSASIDQQIADAEKAGDHARVISLKRAKAHANH